MLNSEPLYILHCVKKLWSKHWHFLCSGFWEDFSRLTPFIVPFNVYFPFWKRVLPSILTIPLLIMILCTKFVFCLNLVQWFNRSSQKFGKSTVGHSVTCKGVTRGPVSEIELDALIAVSIFTSADFDHCACTSTGTLQVSSAVRNECVRSWTGTTLTQARIIEHLRQQRKPNASRECRTLALETPEHQ